MDGTKTRKQVHVIFYTANYLWNAIHAVDDSAKIRMEARSPFATKERASILGGEYDVVMEAEERRAHGSWPFWHPFGVRNITGLN